MAYAPTPVLERMRNRVNLRGKKMPHMKTRCHEWTGANVRGYGMVFSRDVGHNTLVHRLVYKHHYGDVPSSVVIRHKCDNPPCIRPSHLTKGTQRDNIRDMDERGRRNKDHTKHRSTMLDLESVLQIADEYRRGRTFKEIADVWGVAPTTVQQVVNGKSWGGAGLVTKRTAGRGTGKKAEK